VSPRQVFLLFDVVQSNAYWLIQDYFPEVAVIEYEANAPQADDLAEQLEVRRVEVVPVPADCTDGFGCAFWNRPEAHLQPDVLAGMSWTSLLDPDLVAAGVEHLRADLESGEWDRRHGRLRELSELDCGYRLLIAGD
jgi:hypothetical protein